MRLVRCFNIVLVLALAMVACEPDTVCRQSTDVYAGIALKGLEVDSASATPFNSWDSITVQGVGNDSVLYDNRKSVSRVLVPLRTDTNITAFTMVWHGQEDVIYLRHDNTLQFVSMACGCVIFHSIDSAWCKGVWMDSVRVINSAVETFEQDNVWVFVQIEK